jgi:hypothetical protein
MYPLTIKPLFILSLALFINGCGSGGGGEVSADSASANTESKAVLGADRNVTGPRAVLKPTTALPTGASVTITGPGPASATIDKDGSIALGLSRIGNYLLTLKNQSGGIIDTVTLTAVGNDWNLKGQLFDPGTSTTTRVIVKTDLFTAPILDTMVAKGATFTCSGLLVAPETIAVSVAGAP